jgi:uncharacterized Zn-binding protein involved in type VI secretion
MRMWQGSARICGACHYRRAGFADACIDWYSLKMFAPAARVSDPHVCPMVNGLVPHVGGPILPPGAPTTLIAGLPAARVSDMATCVGPPDVIATGSFTVLIAGLAAARLGDTTAHGGKIVMGCPTVLIGDQGSGSGGGAAATMSGARAGAKPFVESNCAAKQANEKYAGSPLMKTGDPKKKSWIEVSLVDDAGNPVPHERYRVTAPDGDVREGFLDDRGLARVDGIDPGTCQITFPNLDRDAWEPG